VQMTKDSMLNDESSAEPFIPVAKA
jgi:hypothetical protein